MPRAIPRSRPEGYGTRHASCGGGRLARRRFSCPGALALAAPSGSTADSREALPDLVPVDDVPPGVEVLRAPVLVLEVVGVLPHVVAEQHRVPLGDRRVLVRGARHAEPRAVVDQPRPAGAEAVDARVLELGFEV